MENHSMDISDPIRNIVIFVFLIVLAQLGLYAHRATKKKVRSGITRNSAVFIGSLFSPHGDMVKEMKATIKNKVKKVDPQDKERKL
jgi:hypothetical protein